MKICNFLSFDLSTQYFSLFPFPSVITKMLRNSCCIYQIVYLYITSKSNKPKTTSLNEIRKQINSFISTWVQISRQILLPHTHTHTHTETICVWGTYSKSPNNTWNFYTSVVQKDTYLPATNFGFEQKFSIFQPPSLLGLHYTFSSNHLKGFHL